MPLKRVALADEVTLAVMAQVLHLRTTACGTITIDRGKSVG